MECSDILNENSIVCRTCLKVLDTTGTGFTYLEDEGGYVKGVGNLREMLQFCLPELDLYVSARPVMCYQCLPILVQIYNFKIKCLNGENIIKAYISRNNLHDYNHVNLNCVLMDDLKLKSQSIQIESRIKNMMLKELPECSDETFDRPDIETFPQHDDESFQMEYSPDEAVCETETSGTITETPEDTIDHQLNEEEPPGEEEELEFKIDTDEIDLCYETIPKIESDQEEENNCIDKTMMEDIDSNPKKDLVVRKDLFEPSSNNSCDKQSVEEPKKNQASLILNNGKRIVIKIDRRKLDKFGMTENKSNESGEDGKVVTAPKVTDTQASTNEKESEVTDRPSEMTGDLQEKETQRQTYTCKKCSFVTHDIIKIYDHNRKKHEFDYTCQYCPFSTSKVELLGKHMTMVHPQYMVLQKNLNYKVRENYACSLCPFSVKSVDLLRSHHLSAHGDAIANKGPIVLNHAFRDDNSRNELRIVKKLEYTCDVCPYTTKDKSNLRKHLFTHGTKPLKCDHCSYKCVSPYQLRRHQKQKHAKQLVEGNRSRNQPYKLPDLRKEKNEALENFKITLETIKREIEKEIGT